MRTLTGKYKLPLESEKKEDKTNDVIGNILTRFKPENTDFATNENLNFAIVGKFNKEAIKGTEVKINTEMDVANIKKYLSLLKLVPMLDINVKVTAFKIDESSKTWKSGNTLTITFKDSKTNYSIDQTFIL